MHYVPAPLALRGFGSGFDSSLAQNPDPQRLRRRFFYAPKWVFLLRICTNLPTRDVLSVTFSLLGLRAITNL